VYAHSSATGIKSPTDGRQWCEKGSGAKKIAKKAGKKKKAKH
jgi:hypothetical protein